MYLENKEIKTVLGERLEKVRKKKKLSVSELAKRTHTGRQTYYDAVSGKYIKPHTLELYAQELGVDVEYLKGEIDEETKEKEYWSLNPMLSPMNTPERINDTIAFISRYGLHVELNDPKAPTAYSVYDADNELIEENKDIKELLPLVQMIHRLFETGHDIVSLFFQEAWLYEE